MSKLTPEQRAELRKLHEAATDRNSSAYERLHAQAALSDRMTWNGFNGGIGEMPALLDDLDEADKERDHAVALIDAAKTGARPESFLEHAQAILAKCIAPYSCEQMKAVGDALAGCYRKWELMSEIAVAANEERDEMRAERDAARAELAAVTAQRDALLMASELACEAIATVVPEEPLDELSPIFQLETKKHHWFRVLDCRDRMEKAITAAQPAKEATNDQ